MVFQNNLLDVLTATFLNDYFIHVHEDTHTGFYKKDDKVFKDNCATTKMPRNRHCAAPKTVKLTPDATAGYQPDIGFTCPVYEILFEGESVIVLQVLLIVTLFNIPAAGQRGGTITSHMPAAVYPPTL